MASASSSIITFRVFSLVATFGLWAAIAALVVLGIIALVTGIRVMRKYERKYLSDGTTATYRKKEDDALGFMPEGTEEA